MPLALLSFNLGVEAGQIMFIAVVLIASAALTRIVPATLRAVQTPGSPVLTGSAYLIGSISAYWVIERIAAF